MSTRPESSPPLDRRDLLFLSLILIVALGMRLAHWRFQEIVSVDGTSYIRLARTFLGGPPYQTAQPPGYPLLLTPLLALLKGDGVLAARITALIAGLGVLIPFYLLGRRLLGSTWALAAGLALALSPLATRYSIVTMSETSYMLLALLTILAARADRPLLTGLMGGLAFHVRPEALLLTGAAALLKGIRPKWWATAALAFVVAGAVPALVYNHATSGEWALTRKGITLVPTDATGGEYSSANLNLPRQNLTLTQRISQYGGAAIRGYPRRLGTEVRQLASTAGWPALAAALAGIVPGTALLVAGLPQVLTVPLFPGIVLGPRMILPVLPFVLLLALAFARRLRGGPRLAALALLAAGWAVGNVPAAKELRIQEDGLYPELVAAGRALRPVASDRTLVFDRKPYTAFYAGTRYQTTPLGDYHATINAMIDAGGDYLVVDEAVVSIFRPELRPLINDSASILNDPRLDPVYVDLSLKERHTIVYRIVRPGGPPPPGGDTRRVRAILSSLPHDPRLHARHAELFWLAGRSEESLREYELAMAAGPLLAADYKNMAILLLELGRDPARALDLVNRARQLDPGQADLDEIERRVRAATAGR